MASYFEDNRDLQYYVDRWIDWERLLEATQLTFDDDEGFASADEARSFYREIAQLVGEFVAEEIAPHAAAIDRRGVHLVDGEVVFPPELDAVFDKIRELDLHGMCLPRELGGMNAPLLAYFVNSELFARADVSTMAHHGFHGGIAMAMLAFSLREGSTEIDPVSGKIVSTRFAEQIAEIARGQAWGCMDITEPDAGSDMARLRAVGEQDAEGRWFVTGEKIFITSGHGKYHFVIARTEKAPDDGDPLAGLRGLSMFLVETYRDAPDGSRTRTVPITRVEEKLGHHGSATCALSFDRAPAELIGERGDGFAHMLTLMNNARLGVGFECLGLLEAAWRAAVEYAAERRSMGKSIDRHEMIADYLDEMRSDIEAVRALCMYGAFHEEMSQKLEMVIEHGRALDDDRRGDLGRRRREHARRARRVTPLLKHLAAEKAVEHARRCLQIHGGNGYMTEYGAEKLLRDAVVMPIYEGTSQIQALMAMKDTLGAIMKNPQAFLRRVAQAKWRSVSARDPLERRVARLSAQSLAVQQHLVVRTAGDKFRELAREPVGQWQHLVTSWDPKRDFAWAMLHAERLTRILTDEAVCDVLWEQARQHEERREVLERYLERAEPRVRHLADQITTTGQRLLDDLARRQRQDAALADAAE